MDASNTATAISVRYASVLSDLNYGISQFNAFLAIDHHLPLISSDNPATFTSALDKPWGQQNWPSKDNPGVYVLCGHDEMDELQLGAYIGKASQQFMGHRLYAHLNPYRQSGIYKRGRFVIDAILAIPISNHDARSIAAALEEFLIARGLSGVTLLNAVGARARVSPFRQRGGRGERVISNGSIFS
jgi:hypothetical protein